MEINDANLTNLSSYLQKTLSPDPGMRRPAEKFLQSIEINRNYGLLLLTLMDRGEVDVVLRTAAAVTFKNYVRRNWKQSEGETEKIHNEDRKTVKDLIVKLMLKSPELIQRQLSDAITAIGREDFPDKWPALLAEMVDKFQTPDFHVVNGVLRTAHSLFKRYRYETKSQKLWVEIKYVLDDFAAPFTQLFKDLMGLAKKHESDAAALRVIFSSIILCCKIFYSLNYQDLPEFFEDNMEVWMSHFHSLLVTDTKLLTTEDENQAGLLEITKSQVCDTVAMYAQKYDEEFKTFLPKFVTAVWNLLLATGPQVKYDLLVSNAIQFLASVARRPGYVQLFEDENTLNSICERVIIPNMQFREADEEAFEDNPEEYMRRDLEMGVDADTRRGASADLIRALSTNFEERIVTVFSQYVINMIQEYQSAPSAKWKCMDAAIFMVTSLASKGQTVKYGTTSTSKLVNVVDFYQNSISPELQSDNVEDKPVLKAGCIKYLATFRSQLPPELLTAAVPALIRLLQARLMVVHSYAAHTMERIFLVRHPQQTNRTAISAGELAPHANQLMSNLFTALNHPGSAENDFIMKAIMRSLSILQKEILPLLDIILQKLKEKLVAVSKNPSKPQFNHFLFESLSVAVRVGCGVSGGVDGVQTDLQQLAKMEGILFPVFQEILQQDVLEFVPYVFQMMALLLELRPDPAISAQPSAVPPPTAYTALFPHLILPALWERPGSVPALSRLLQAFIQKVPSVVEESDKVPAILGVFQKLIASKTNDHEGFHVVRAMILYMKPESLSIYINQVFLLLFNRLQSSKTTKFIKHLIVFFSTFAIKHGGAALVDVVDGIQPNMFGMVVEKIILADMQKVDGRGDKRIVALGITKVLTESEKMMLGQYSMHWCALLQALIGLFELPTSASTEDEEEHFAEPEQPGGSNGGYESAFVRLAFSGSRDRDIFASTCPDVKRNLAEALAKCSTAFPGKISALSSGLDPTAAQYLKTYVDAARVTIN